MLAGLRRNGPASEVLPASRLLVKWAGDANRASGLHRSPNTHLASLPHLQGLSIAGTLSLSQVWPFCGRLFLSSEMSFNSDCIGHASHADCQLCVYLLPELFKLNVA